MPQYVCSKCKHEDDEQVNCPFCGATLKAKAVPAAKKEKVDKNKTAAKKK